MEHAKRNTLRRQYILIISHVRYLNKFFYFMFILLFFTEYTSKVTFTEKKKSQDKFKQKYEYLLTGKNENEDIVLYLLLLYYV